MMSNAELMDRGIMCLLNVLGSVDTERFISNILREKFDYTKWQQQRFDNISSDDFFNAAIDYEKTHPFETINK